MLRFFRREDLEPYPRSTMSREPSPLLTAGELAQIEDFARRFTASGQCEFSRDLSGVPAHVRMFLAGLASLGAVRVEVRERTVQVWESGRMARHVPLMLSLYHRNGYTLVEDWNRSGVLLEDCLSGVEFAHRIELRRIEQDRRSGAFPEPLAERPVAFGIFHARNARGESCYLFELNKDWARLNLIGGKQEPEDGGDFSVTLHREISEELGIAPARVTLNQLNPEPIVGYGLSGNAGSLARYPCVLFGVRVRGGFGIRPKDQWVTEADIRAAMAAEDCPIMVNPEYLAFLLEGSPSRLARCPLSTDEVVRTEPAAAVEFRGRPTPTAVAAYASRPAFARRDVLLVFLTVLAGLLLALYLAR